MADPKVAVCAIVYPTQWNRKSQATVMVAFRHEDGTVDDECVDLFDYYTDELSFLAIEFIGLTKREANDLFFRKDQAYLRS